MDLFNGIILGVVEGVTEFLPVSSTAHLIIVSRLLGIVQTDFHKMFEVVIQSGAILAVVVAYARYVRQNPQIIRPVIVSFIPTAIVGMAFHQIITGVFFESTSLIVTSLFFIGVVFLVVEYMISHKMLKMEKRLESLSMRDAFLIGVGQSFSVVPGVSRAGIVILSAIFLGYRRQEAALYSFLLAVPTITAASILELYKNKEMLFAPGANLGFLAVGFVTSFVVALVTIKWLVDYLKHHTLHIFGIYRIALAIILLLTLR